MRRAATNVEPALLTPEQAAVRLGVGRTKVYQMLRSRELEGVKLGRSRRVFSEDVDALIARWRDQMGAIAGLFVLWALADQLAHLVGLHLHPF